MKQYYTLVHPFLQETGRDLGSYLHDQGIEYRLGAEFASKVSSDRQWYPGDPLLKKYTILIDEHELSAIKLAISEVDVVQNRPFVSFINKIRILFSWFF